MVVQEGPGGQVDEKDLRRGADLESRRRHAVRMRWPSGEGRQINGGGEGMAAIHFNVR